jgi:hypothetical protein
MENSGTFHFVQLRGECIENETGLLFLLDFVEKILPVGAQHFPLLVLRHGLLLDPEFITYITKEEISVWSLRKLSPALLLLNSYLSVHLAVVQVELKHGRRGTHPFVVTKRVDFNDVHFFFFQVDSPVYYLTNS